MIKWGTWERLVKLERGNQITVEMWADPEPPSNVFQSRCVITIVKPKIYPEIQFDGPTIVVLESKCTSGIVTLS